MSIDVAQGCRCWSGPRYDHELVLENVSLYLCAQKCRWYKQLEMFERKDVPLERAGCTRATSRTLEAVHRTHNLADHLRRPIQYPACYINASRAR